MSSENTLYHKVEGHGHPLVLISGLGGLGIFWKEVSERLARSYRVITFDHPGVGKSPASSANPSISEIADGVVGLLDHLGIATAHIVGHSTGGLVTQALALDYANRIDRIVISGSWARPDKRFIDLFDLRRTVLEKLGQTAYKAMSNLIAYPSEWYEEHIAESERINFDVGRDADARTGAARIRMLLAFDRANELRSIKAGTLVVGASDDQVVPFHHSEQLSRLIPGADLIEMTGGHFFPVLKANKYAAIINDHLEEGIVKNKVERIGIIGMGAIGRRVLISLKGGPFDQAHFATLETAEHAANLAKSYPQLSVFNDIDALIKWGPTLVIECAGHAAVKHAVPVLLKHGIDVVIASVGALSDSALKDILETTARESGANLMLVSGAIGGLDALRSARAGGLDSVKYIGRKPPGAWVGTPAENLFDLTTITSPTSIFKGNALEAARLYPKNANVTAAVALSGLGFERTEVELWADPMMSRNVHEVEAAGSFGCLSMRLENNPLPENPKTSWLAALSIEEAVSRHSNNVTF